MSWKADADPTKDFFIDMITRDIGLDECIFDLLDNSVDGAKRESLKHPSRFKKYEGYKANLTILPDRFCIEDNCGGIPLDEAINYAFHFGRKQGGGQTTNNSIGLYGIGMKRAIFKIGQKVRIESATDEKPKEAFTTTIKVLEWAQRKDWDFDLDEWDSAGFVGTRISIEELKNNVSAEFSSEVFLNNLQKDIGKYYSFILQDGFEIYLNGVAVNPYNFRLRSGSELAPIYESFADEEDTAVQVTVAAGLAGLPPDDPGSTDIKISDAEYWGWFVVCNDRVVLAGDKSDRTVWGDAGFSVWHPQYNGFMGIVTFTSSNPSALPWTTTKREVDETSPLYRRAVQRMKQATRQYTAYTGTRKGAIDSAKQIESAAPLTPIRELAHQATMKLPVFPKTSVIAETTISYTRPKALVDKVAKSLGRSGMSNREVGIKTFQYYVDNEVGDE